jgi:hypothetical protein
MAASSCGATCRRALHPHPPTSTHIHPLHALMLSSCYHFLSFLRRGNALSSTMNTKRTRQEISVRMLSFSPVVISAVRSRQSLYLTAGSQEVGCAALPVALQALTAAEQSSSAGFEHQNYVLRHAVSPPSPLLQNPAQPSA